MPFLPESFNNLAACNCDKTPTLLTLGFQILVIIAALFSFAVLRRYQKRILVHFLIIALGIGVFEIFTAPMWNSSHLGWWAYIYKDVSWILNLAWTTAILSTVVLVDHFCKRLPSRWRFFIYLINLTPAVFLAEIVLVNIGIRTYSPEVLHTVIGLMVFGVPIEALYYVPVFMSLVIAFYKYWTFYLEKRPIVPIKKTPWVRNLTIALIGVFFFEMMIEPMVVNVNLPSWSYIYRDISILISGAWIIIIWLAVNLVERFFLHFDLKWRFALYLLIGSLITYPLESWLMIHGYRVYGPSATANFSGFITPVTHIPIEVAFAVPMYLALVIAFIRYWEIVLDNKL